MARSEYILGDRKARRVSRRGFWHRAQKWIFGSLAAIYILLATSAMERDTNLLQVRLDFERIEHAVRLFRADSGRCPDGLDELWAEDVDQKYLSKLTDPWGQSYDIVCPAPRDPGGVEIWTMGSEGEKWVLSNHR